mgnify:CR=1 FL=1
MLSWIAVLAHAYRAMHAADYLGDCIDTKGKSTAQVTQELNRVGLKLNMLEVDRGNRVEFGKLRSRHATTSGHEVQVYAYDLKVRGIREQFDLNVKLIQAIQRRPYYPYATSYIRGQQINYIIYRQAKPATPLIQANRSFEGSSLADPLRPQPAQPWNSSLIRIRYASTARTSPPSTPRRACATRASGTRRGRFEWSTSNALSNKERHLRNVITKTGLLREHGAASQSSGHSTITSTKQNR